MVYHPGVVRALVAALLFSVACSKPGDETAAKRSPMAPPPPATALPAELSIPVEVDGATAEPITGERLSSLEPDFADAERRAWRLTRLIPAYDRDGATIEAFNDSGVAIAMARPRSATEPQPVLFFTRRGDVVAAVVDPAEPFPYYHGQGGRLRRPGDPLPRISPVARLRVSGPAAAPAP